MADKFKVGDIVILKSGSPQMTVTQVTIDHGGASRRVWTAWFSGKKNETSSFPEDAIIMAPKEK
jgi:uncharacterized protein YodC (DUF2158 family)